MQKAPNKARSGLFACAIVADFSADGTVGEPKVSISNGVFVAEIFEKPRFLEILRHFLRWHS
jgi:hypothetical protein